MNIFWIEYDGSGTSYDPWKSAFSVCDKHVNSQIRESALMLNALFKRDKAPLGHTHLHHPCTVWTLTCINNYLAHCEHAMGLCESYASRYRREHAMKDTIQWLMRNWYQVQWHRTDLSMDMSHNRTTVPPIALGLETHPERAALIKEGDIVETYRNYYKSCKRHFAAWNHGPTPSWWNAWPILLEENHGKSKSAS